MTYWQHAFQSYKTRGVFDKIPAHIHRAVGSLAVYTQIARFDIDWATGGNQAAPRYDFLIRIETGRISGTLRLSGGSIWKLKNAYQGRPLFIGLSAGKEKFPNWSSKFVEPPLHLIRHLQHLRASEIYGCPCVSRIDTTSTTRTTKSQTYIVECIPQHEHYRRSPCVYQVAANTATSTTKSQLHIVECEHHPEFSTLTITSRYHAPTTTSTYYAIKDSEKTLKLWGENKEHMQAYYKSMTDLSYWTPLGERLHEQDVPPELNVMLVAPHEDHEEGSMVYRRLGLGKIYLKRWVEAEPNFETLVLR